MQPVYFKKSNNWGSSFMRGNQIVEALNTIGFTATINFDLANVKNSIIVFVKYAKMEEILLAKKNNNLIIYDLVDYVACKPEHDISNTTEFMHLLNMFDCVISPTTLGKYTFLVSSACPITVDIEVIPHHHDPRLIHNLYKEFSLGYIGMPHNILFQEDLPELNVFSMQYSFEEFLKTACPYSYHYSVRKKDSIEYVYKPATKVFNASACGSNIITSRDSNTMEFLPWDYPYLTDSYLPSVINTIQYAKDTFGSEIWERGLQMLKEVKYKTHILEIVKQYKKLFLNLRK